MDYCLEKLGQYYVKRMIEEFEKWKEELKMKCKYCSNELRIDDVDFNFKGNKDIYHVCDNCGASAFEKIRYGKSLSVEFHKEEEAE